MNFKRRDYGTRTRLRTAYGMMVLHLATLLLASTFHSRLTHALIRPTILRLERYQKSLSNRDPRQPATATSINPIMSSTSITDDGQSTSTVLRIFCYGDSLTAGTSTSAMDLFPYAPHLEQALNSQNTVDRLSFVVRHRGMPGWTADAMVDAADDSRHGLRSAIRGIQNPSLSCVLILVGTNDLGYALARGSSSKEDQVSTILTPIQALHEMAWSEGVQKTIAIAIPPSGYQSDFKQAADLAQQVNQELADFCQSSNGKGVFIPFPFGYESGGDNWSSDTLHFSPKGYEVLGKYMADPVLQVLKELNV